MKFTSMNNTPTLFGLNQSNTNKDFSQAKAWGKQGYLVFGSDLDFRSQMLRFSRNIASTALNVPIAYSGKMFTHIK